VTALVYTRSRAIPMWNSASTLLAIWVSALLIGAVGNLIIAASVGAADGFVRGLALTTFVLVLCDALVAGAAEIEVSVRARALELPRLLSIHLARWIVGLVIPVTMLAVALSGGLDYGIAGVIAGLGIICGESMGRLIFFARGVHM
jgi:DMSO reductase anchor subunit